MQAQRDRSEQKENESAEVGSSGVRSDAASPEVRGPEVQASGVRVTKKGAETAERDLGEETALGRLLFGWGAGATIFGLIIGGLWFEPMGAVVGALIGSVVGVLSVVSVVLVRRGLKAPNR